MKNRGSTPIVTNLIWVHQRNIHTKFEAYPSSGSREVEKPHADDGHRMIASHTHSLSVTKNHVLEPDPK